MHFDQKKTIGALGTLIVAKWYRSLYQKSLLISLDSAEARRWMSLEQDAQRADLLGLTVEHGKVCIDIIEAKSGEDARHVYSLEDDGSISGKPVDQLLNTGRSVGAIFGLNDLKDNILTPPRREILRNHFYRQGFAANRSPEEKVFWRDTLNGLFSGESKPTVRLNLVVVNLGLNHDAIDKAVPAQGGNVRLVHLTESAVNLHITAPTAKPTEPEQRPSVTKGKGPKASAKRAERPVEIEETPARKGSGEVQADLRTQIERTCGLLRASCQDFGIRVSEIDPANVDVGPSVLRYKIKLAAGEQGEKLRRQAENIARQLAATNVPIIEFLRGTEFMSLDLARPDRQNVLLEPVLKEASLNDMNDLPLFVGTDPSGKEFRLDLGDDRLPHLLVAGGTGSGKTIFLYSVVLGLVSLHSEKSLEMVIIDPKQTDFTIFSKLPHLRDGKVIMDASKGCDLVYNIVEHDLQKRSDLLQNAQCRDIKTYNQENPRELLRPLVIVIDEYADLVASLSKKDREQFDRVVGRLAARGRNVGIHLVLATQRPTADVVTGNIKANMPCRISFSLPSSRDSQVILDEPGAERLLRKGDMLLLLEGRLIRLQGYYVDQKTAERLLKGCRRG